MDYFWLKYLHILGAFVLGGTGMGIAFFMWISSRTRDPQVVAAVTQFVVIADWVFTAPAIVIQFITGLLLAQQLGIAWSSTWFITVVVLYLLIGCCWLPVVFIQYKLRNIARASRSASALPRSFYNYLKVWMALGVPAFSMLVIVVWLMVTKALL